MAKKLTSDEMMAAILSYLGILVLIPLLAIKKKNDFVSFHVSQGMNLFILEVIFVVASFVLAWVPIIGSFVSIIMTVVYLLFLVASVAALIKALQGNKWKIPVVGDVKLYK